MSIHRSYFSKNNTIFLNNLSNTGRNPVVDLYFGSDKDNVSFSGYSRFIFDLDLDFGINNFINVGIQPGFKDSSTYIIYLTSGGLGLPERGYYFDEDNLPDIEEGIARCEDALGKDKVILDEFFKEHDAYNNEMIVQYYKDKHNETITDKAKVAAGVK